jgi:hypothetical protein
VAAQTRPVPRHARPVRRAQVRGQQAGQATARGGQRIVTAPVSAGSRAGRVTKGGQHALMAEFLVFLGIVSMRAIADYVPGSQGEATEGTTKGTVTPASGQLGPLPILAAGFVIFFILSFLAARGGTWARVASLAGLIIDTALLMKSIPELEKVSGSFGTVRASAQAAQTVPTPSGQLPYDEQITGA